MRELYIGLMSGTSVDGIDAALVDFSDQQPRLIASHYHEFNPEHRQQILALCEPGHDEINRLGEVDILLGTLFAETVNTLLNQQKIDAESIRAIGSHGQTIRHHPTRQFTLQIGDPNTIAAKTGITTIADFRRKDMAKGGQGAPLVPAFHHSVFAAKQNRVIVNIGGMANITLLPGNSHHISGFDTGPGNVLLNAWITKHLHKPYDNNGEWAASGKINPSLLKKLLSDPFFSLPAPKSTGREYFNLAWLEKQIDKTMQPADVEATLVALTAESIIQAISQSLPHSEIFVCGGGVHNPLLMQHLSKLANATVQSTKIAGVDPDWIEAMAFAWLAKQTLEKKPGNIPAVTGARAATILGGIYHGER